MVCFVAMVPAERPEERAAAAAAAAAVVVPGGQDLSQILQDVGDDVYQQYRLTRQGSDFDSQSAFHINVSPYDRDPVILVCGWVCCVLSNGFND